MNLEADISVTNPEMLIPDIIDDPMYGDKMDNNQIFVDVTWYNRVGIVITFDFYERRYKSYISSIIIGNTEINDIQNIASMGSKFPIEAAKLLFPHIDFDQDVVDVMDEGKKEVQG